MLDHSLYSSTSNLKHTPTPTQKQTKPNNQQFAIAIPHRPSKDNVKCDVLEDMQGIFNFDLKTAEYRSFTATTQINPKQYK